MIMKKITPAQAAGLVGESLSLPVAGLVMQAVYMHNQNPWWDRKANALVQESDKIKQEAHKVAKAKAQQQAAATSSAKRKRKTGGV
jgi:hypothetical protein